jgi:hypothetical protein
MAQIRLGIKYKSSSLGTVTIDPATAGVLETRSGQFTNPPLTARIVQTGALFVEIYNAGMTSSGGVPGLVEIQATGSATFNLEVGQTWRMEATLDPVTNTFLYCPAILVFSNDSMVFLTVNRAL